MNTPATTTDRKQFVTRIAGELKAAVSSAFPGVKFSVKTSVVGNPVPRSKNGVTDFWYADAVTVTCFGHPDLHTSLWDMTRAYATDGRVAVKVNAFD